MPVPQKFKRITAAPAAFRGIVRKLNQLIRFANVVHAMSGDGMINVKVTDGNIRFSLSKEAITSGESAPVRSWTSSTITNETPTLSEIQAAMVSAFSSDAPEAGDVVVLKTSVSNVCAYEVIDRTSSVPAVFATGNEVISFDVSSTTFYAIRIFQAQGEEIEASDAFTVTSTAANITTAIEAAYSSKGRGPRAGDLIIFPAFTFRVTREAITANGIFVVLFTVDSVTFRATQTGPSRLL